MNTKYYWENREERKHVAKVHVDSMNLKYPNEIAYSISKSKIYGPELDTTIYKPDSLIMHSTIRMQPLDSVSAIFKYSDLVLGGKTAVLNFASYKNPGGMFLEGSRAQEESLCHESTLYNVISNIPEYYEWNKKNLNHAMYTDRALYSPDIVFERDGIVTKCDVITCAAPNLTVGRRYNMISVEDNSLYLYNRIDFLLSVAKMENVKTLILGAFGCGVFGQEPYEVARIFGMLLAKKYECAFMNVIFAVIPDKTFEIFKIGFQDGYKIK